MKQQHTPGPWNVSECGSIEFADGFLGEAYDFNGTTNGSANSVGRTTSSTLNEINP